MNTVSAGRLLLLSPIVPANAPALGVSNTGVPVDPLVTKPGRLRGVRTAGNVGVFAAADADVESPSPSSPSPEEFPFSFHDTDPDPNRESFDLCPPGVFPLPAPDPFSLSASAPSAPCPGDATWNGMNADSTPVLGATASKRDANDGDEIDETRDRLRALASSPAPFSPPGPPCRAGETYVL